MANSAGPAKSVRVAVVGPRPLEPGRDRSPAAMAKTTTERLISELEQVLPDRPDIILLPEACDRPAGLSAEEKKEYYRFRGQKILERVSRVAADNGSYIVYSAIRELEDATFRNSSAIIDRTGAVVGIYDKNHLVIEETTEGDILCGSTAPVYDLDFGRVGCAICFDLNFDELRLGYAAAARKNPIRLLLFSSMYHGGLVQQFWAYSCRSYFAGAIAGPPSEIRNPFGEVVASSTNYTDYAIADINLDYCLVHFDYHWEKLAARRQRWGRRGGPLRACRATGR